MYYISFIHIIVLFFIHYLSKRLLFYLLQFFIYGLII